MMTIIRNGVYGWDILLLRQTLPLTPTLSPRGEGVTAFLTSTKVRQRYRDSPLSPRGEGVIKKSIPSLGEEAESSLFSTKIQQKYLNSPLSLREG
jgi:hypothetical protein